MRITAVRASWLRAEIPADRAHVSDFGKNDSFNTCLLLEFSRGENPLLNDLTEEGFELHDGHVRAPTGPGLGLTRRRDVASRITVAV